MSRNISTQEETISKTREAIIDEAKRLEENCLYTAKGHFITAYFWSKFHLWIGIPTVILAAITGTLIFAKSGTANTLAGIFSIIIIVLTAITTFLNPKETANTHLTAGNNYDALLVNARIFWSVDCKIENSEQVLTEKIKDLSDRRDRLNKESPQVPTLAYRKAKRAIARGEAEYAIHQAKKHS